MRGMTFYFNTMVVIDRKNEDRNIFQEGYLLYFSTYFFKIYISCFKSSLRNAVFFKIVLCGLHT